MSPSSSLTRHFHSRTYWTPSFSVVMASEGPSTPASGAPSPFTSSVNSQVTPVKSLSSSGRNHG